MIEVIKDLVKDGLLADYVITKIGQQTDDTELKNEIKNYEAKLKEVDLNKVRLEKEIDNLPIDTRYRGRKIKLPRWSI